jgi:hypothetical protein
VATKSASAQVVRTSPGLSVNLSKGAGSVVVTVESSAAPTKRITSGSW